MPNSSLRATLGIEATYFISETYELSPIASLYRNGLMTHLMPNRACRPVCP
jgi:hypothetical protein